ncbi:ABC transporter permease [Oryzicola mucosus]|uniref:ABC transporter permease n=1 Tax=Oryzicola mucosus TaxID=2767425 RepID=A0A8J6PX88_9HYPH|nr:ABC transporter permease [Oryzicola mucosus]MBD0416881.1 ABC transporter permease [Oryzicola mucosus]
MFGQLVFSGIAIGSLYALVALGLVLVFKSTNLINFAYGQMAMLSTFFGYTLLEQFGLPYGVSFVGALIFSALLAIAVQLILRPARSGSAVIVATLALYMIFSAVAGMIWGWDPQSFPTVFSGDPVIFFDIVASPESLFNLAVTFALMIMMFLFFKFTMIGIAMRALSQNQMAASLMGISVDRLFILTWALSGILGGVAGFLVAPTTFLDTNMMAVLLLKAFTAAVLGGFTSYPGVVLGGLTLGVLENLVAGYVSTELKDTFSFVLLIAVLCIRPEGMLGKPIRMLGKKATEEHTPFDSSARGLSRARKLLLLAAAVAFPLLFHGNTYILYFACLVGIYMIVAIGLDFLIGYTGQISLGHAALFAIGAYSSALLTLDFGLPFLLALVASGVIAGLAGLLLGLSALRLSGLYLAIATLGLGEAMPHILMKWDSVTNGYNGLKPARPSIAGFVFDSEFKLYFLILAVLVVVMLVTNNLLHSKIGRAFIASRDSEAGAEAMGIPLSRYRILAFVLSAVFAGIAGSLYAHVVGFISPSDFNSWMSLVFLCMVFVGGVGSIPGAMLGAAFMTAAPQFFVGSKSLSGILFGGALLIIILFFPKGLAGIYATVVGLFVSAIRGTSAAAKPVSQAD